MYSPFIQSSLSTSKIGPTGLKRSTSKLATTSSNEKISRPSDMLQPCKARKFTSASGRKPSSWNHNRRAAGFLRLLIFDRSRLRSNGRKNPAARLLWFQEEGFRSEE